jgi:hypothetical protein
VGERTVRVAAQAPREIELEIEQLRTGLDRSLAELDRRRRELTDLKVQIRKHPGVFIGAGGVLLFVVGGVGFAIWRSQRRAELPGRAKRFQLAVGRAVHRPRKLARGAALPWDKIVAAVGTTVAVSLTRKLLERALTAVPARA